jgi:GNAT superfamily N-acetyltransferase
MLVVNGNERMNGSLCCREASKSDLPDVLRLYAQPDLDDGKVLSTSEAERIFDRMARYPNYRVYVAVSDARVVGTFALLVMDNLGHLGAPSAIIEDVAVDPAYQGKGIGKEMMRHAIQLASDNGCYKAMLSSNLKREGAHAFYESLGFERHGYSFSIGPQQATGVGGARKRGAPRSGRNHDGGSQ